MFKSASVAVAEAIDKILTVPSPVQPETVTILVALPVPETVVEEQVTPLMDSVTSADQQVKTANEGVRLAEDELTHARRRYETGITNSIEVTDAQTRLARARENVINALYNHNLARIDLASAMGKIETVVH